MVLSFVAGAGCGRCRRARPQALGAQADRLHQHLVGHPDLDLADVAYSLASHPHPAPLSGGDHRGGQASADAARRPAGRSAMRLRTGQPHPQLTQHHYLAHLRGKTVFVFPGQGGQYPGMGRELYEHHRVFAATGRRL